MSRKLSQRHRALLLHLEAGGTRIPLEDQDHPRLLGLVSYDERIEKEVRSYPGSCRAYEHLVKVRLYKLTDRGRNVAKQLRAAMSAERRVRRLLDE